MPMCYILIIKLEYSVLVVMDATIRKLRELRALSQRELAARAKLSVTTLNRIELGRHKPLPRTVRKLAEALGVTPEELLSEQPRLME